MKTFADCKVVDEMYIVLSTSCLIEEIAKIDDHHTHLCIHTEHYSLRCPKDDEKHLFMFCNRDLVFKEFERMLAWHQKQINKIQQSINDLKEI